MLPARTLIPGLTFLLLLAGSGHSAARETTPAHTHSISLVQALEQVSRNGEDWPRLHSLLISQHGKLVFERYFNGHQPDRLENVKSISKSILSALIGIAIDRGDINSLDVTLNDYFGAQLQELGDSERSAITLKHLLTMQAGLRSTSNGNYGAWVASENWIDAVIESPLDAGPGQQMVYSTGNTHLLSAILTRATGRSTLDYAREVLARPLGFELAAWPRDPQGIYFGGNDMELTPRQLVSIGELYLNGGQYDGQQIVSPEWVQDSLAAHVRSENDQSRYYGYGWWLAELMGHDVPHAWGHGGQFIMLVPDLDLVLVSTSSARADAQANRHANKVYGLLQHAIRTVDRHTPNNGELVAGRR